MNSERELFLDAVASKNWIDKQSIERDYKFSDGKFIALKRDDIEYADWLNIGWEMWCASAQRQGYKLVPVEMDWCKADKLASDAFNNSQSLFDHEYRGYSAVQKEQIRLRWCKNKAHQIINDYKAMIGAVDNDH